MFRKLTTTVDSLVQRPITIAATSSPSPLSVWPHLFRVARHEKRRGEQLKWSLQGMAVHWKFSTWTAARTSSYSPVGPSVFFVYLA